MGLMSAPIVAQANVQASASECQVYVDRFFTRDVPINGTKALIAELRVRSDLVELGVEEVGFYAKSIGFGRNGVPVESDWSVRSAFFEPDLNGVGIYRVSAALVDAGGRQEGVFFVRTTDGVTYWLNPLSNTDSNYVVQAEDGFFNFLIPPSDAPALAYPAVFDPFQCR